MEVNAMRNVRSIGFLFGVSFLFLQACNLADGVEDPSVEVSAAAVSAQPHELCPAVTDVIESFVECRAFDDGIPVTGFRSCTQVCVTERAFELRPRPHCEDVETTCGSVNCQTACIFPL